MFLDMLIYLNKKDKRMLIRETDTEIETFKEFYEVARLVIARANNIFKDENWSPEIKDDFNFMIGLGEFNLFI
jgi:hypothetical protein